MDVINVVIVDDHKAICSGLSSYLRNTEGVNVIAELHSGKELFSYLTKNSPNVIVMDIKLLGDEKSENGLLITKSLRNQGILIPIIIYSGYDYLPYEKVAFQFGANAFVSKNDPLHRLVEMIFLVRTGLTIRDSKLLEDEPLTDYEILILNHIALGKTNKEIAKSLHVSSRTLEYYISNIYRKLGVDSRIQSVVKGIYYGYITDNMERKIRAR